MSEQSSRGRALMKTGTALKSLRVGRGWTLADVSKRTGIPVSTLSKVENGRTELTMDRVLRISVALEVNIADLFGSPTKVYARREIEVDAASPGLAKRMSWPPPTVITPITHRTCWKSGSRR